MSGIKTCKQAVNFLNKISFMPLSRNSISNEINALHTTYRRNWWAYHDWEIIMLFLI
ncbi:MAG: hypothetical protein JXB88_18780 [Spirochaetales bacterium]|nr:hypothetical protein [Spirochaetales bacterium]